MALAKPHRLAGSKRFQEVIRSRSTVSGRFLSMKVLRTQTTVRTCAVVVPVRVAALATQRNALRRAVIAIVSTILPKTSPGYEAVITVKMNHLPPHTQLKYEVVSLFVESGILTQ